MYASSSQSPYPGSLLIHFKPILKVFDIPVDLSDRLLGPLRLGTCSSQLGVNSGLLQQSLRFDVLLLID
ncbi:hypothetical protein MSNKSG1_01973 [Marinobacter santoriniensis NKSG1]|uniref:Uncharacterized protein n=1 Tax=Marinobacter santoriniensis NKSG1 TaxID=1288826 RepID=M7CW45_9GAMM|nr:hypothetical protein MSNKSG1_01973 [Marinobacter santoriniensis NKSG1]